MDADIMADSTLKEAMDALSPGKKGEAPDPTVGIWVRKDELETVAKGEAKDGHAGNLAKLLDTVKQPVYEEKDGRQVRKPDEFVHGADGVKSLLDGFGGDGSGIRRIHLDKEKVAASPHAEAATALIDETKVRETARQEASKERAAVRKESKGKESAGVEA